MRRLHVIPIVHSNEDLGKLAPQIDARKSELVSAEQIQTTRHTVRSFWEELRKAIEAWSIDFSNLLVFQDALPVEPKGGEGIPLLIVNDLAEKGSQNHVILRWLGQQGAQIVGTESSELLLEEYRLAKQMLENEDYDDTDSADRTLGLSLLNQRDQFIADRIDDLLDEETVGLLFIGLMHSVEEKLPNDIAVEYPFGAPVNTTIHDL